MNFSLPVYVVSVDEKMHFIPGDEVYPYPSGFNLEKFQYTADLSDNNVPKWQEVFNWCKETLPNKFTWKGRRFFFVSEHDHLLFMLRWS